MITVNIAGSDNVTGKKVKMELSSMIFDHLGGVKSVSYRVLFFEADNTTPAIPAGGSGRQKKVVSSFTEEYVIGEKSILTTTKVYSPLLDIAEVPIPNATLLSEYLKTKAINTFPSTGGGTPLSECIEGIFKEIISIQIANNEIL